MKRPPGGGGSHWEGGPQQPRCASGSGNEVNLGVFSWSMVCPRFFVSEVKTPQTQSITEVTDRALPST